MKHNDDPYRLSAKDKNLEGFEAALPGWFAVAFTSDLVRGKPFESALSGQTVAVFRDDAGNPVVLDAHCSHMGVKFTSGGRIVNGNVECPFHGFQFDKDGKCVKGYEGCKLPKNNKVKSYPAVERDGVIFAFFGEGEPWEFIEKRKSPRGKTWNRGVSQYRRVSLHGQQLHENTPDSGHFARVHGLEVLENSELTINKHVLTQYYAVRPFGLPKFLEDMRVKVNVTLVGLGYADTIVETPFFTSRTRIMTTQVTSTVTDIRLWVQVEKPRVFPRWMVTSLLGRQFFNETRQDVNILSEARFVEKPRLADGDGEILKFRKWAQQFHDVAAEKRRSLPVVG